MTSANSWLNVDFSYPGIDIKIEMLGMLEYINQMEAGVKSVCQSYLTKELSKYSGSEYEEYHHAYIFAEDEIPRLVRFPFVVSIYTVFENSVTQLLTYGKEREAKELSLKDINANSISSKFNKYMKHILGFEFQISEEAMRNLSEINKVRNCVAHANGNLQPMSEDKVREIEKIRDGNIGVSIEYKRIDVSYEYLRNSMLHVEGVVSALMLYMENRYGFYQ